MEHVSTLCALGTVGLAPTGLALGCVESKCRTEPTSIVSSVVFGSHPGTSRLSTPATPNIPAPDTPALNDEKGYQDLEKYVEGRPSKDEANGVARLRQRRQTYTHAPVKGSADQPGARHARRPSSSWLRRLSTVSYQTETSPAASQASPSIDGSTASTLSRPSSQRRAPNKLVKRLSLHQGSSDFGPVVYEGPASPIQPMLRRPATSHQRSQSTRLQALDGDIRRIGSYFGEGRPAQESVWQPYLRSTGPGDVADRSKRRFSTTARPRDQPLRFLAPSKGAAPSLVPATSVIRRDRASAADIADANQFTLPQLDFRDPFQTTEADFQLAEPPLRKIGNQRPSNQPGGGGRVVPSVETTETRFAPELRHGFANHAEERAESTPPASCRPKEERAVQNVLRTHRRRNITDPDVFARPDTAPPSGLPVALPVKLRQSLGGAATVSLPRMAGTDLRRPSTSGATVDLQSTDASYHRAEPRMPSSLVRPRANRVSLAGSDPASTLIGSDDTRVFASGDEEDADLFSEGAFDSIRTRTTVNSNYEPHDYAQIDMKRDESSELSVTEAGLANLEDLVAHGTFDVRAGEAYCLANTDTSHEPLAVSPLSAKGPVHRAVSVNSTWSDGNDVSGIGPLPDAGDRHLSLGTLSIEADSAETDVAPNQKLNPFDWSEQSRNDSEQADSIARPSTVHGLQGGGGDVRGSRAPGRKGPHAMHLRSQSVPVAREGSADTDARQQSGKFGTWGLGSKGASEDWDNDFDFDEGEGEDSKADEQEIVSKNLPGKEMVVPQAIMERQASVYGQFGQVQELTLLVEELKRLRHQASLLHLVQGPSSELWKEAEGIVHLATVNDDEHDLTVRRTPSTLTFSFVESDADEDADAENDLANRDSGQSWQSRASTHASFHLEASLKPGPPSAESTGPAVAIVDMIFHHGAGNDPSSVDAKKVPSRKLAFDTQSLRDLVVRAGAVTRSLKEVVRRAEGVTSSPPKDTVMGTNPSYNRIFDQSTATVPTRCVGSFHV